MALARRFFILAPLLAAAACREPNQAVVTARESPTPAPALAAAAGEASGDAPPPPPPVRRTPENDPTLQASGPRFVAWRQVACPRARFEAIVPPGDAFVLSDRCEGHGVVVRTVSRVRGRERILGRFEGAVTGVTCLPPSGAECRLHEELSGPDSMSRLWAVHLHGPPRRRLLQQGTDAGRPSDEGRDDFKEPQWPPPPEHRISPDRRRRWDPDGSGALVIVDLRTGTSRRLTLHPEDAAALARTESSQPTLWWVSSRYLAFSAKHFMFLDADSMKFSMAGPGGEHGTPFAITRDFDAALFGNDLGWYLASIEIPRGG